MSTPPPPPFPPPLVIAVDLDEVLGLFVETLVRFHNDEYGSELKVDHFHSYDFMHVWGGTMEEANQKVHAFFDSTHFKEELPPIPEAYPVLKELKSKGVDFHLVTSRQHRIQKETEEWISRHYPDIFTELHYGNHYSSTGPQRSKGEMCQAIGAQLLIDDSFRYALQVSTDAQIEVLLFGNYPWNQHPPSSTPSHTDTHTPTPTHTHTPPPLPPLVKRVTHWDQVRQHIEHLHHHHTQKHTHTHTHTHKHIPIQSGGEEGEKDEK